MSEDQLIMMLSDQNNVANRDFRQFVCAPLPDDVAFLAALQNKKRLRNDSTDSNTTP